MSKYYTNTKELEAMVDMDAQTITVNEVLYNFSFLSWVADEAEKGSAFRLSIDDDGVLWFTPV